jgi:hypothetical protein
MYVPLDSPKYSELKRKIISIIDLSIDKSYLAMYFKPYLSYANDPMLYELYECLNAVNSNPGKYSTVVADVLTKCQYNDRLMEVIQEFIKKFYQ